MPVMGNPWYQDYVAMERMGLDEAGWYALSRQERARHIVVPMIQNALDRMWLADKPKPKK